VKRYLSVDDILMIHADMLSRFGGIRGMRDPNALSSAVGRLQSGYYADVVEEAAALFESLSQNHPFLDGNKRTAIATAGVFLRINGFKLNFNDIEAYEWLIARYERNEVTKKRIEKWFRDHVAEMAG
jgi:death on curing protein